MAGCGRESGGSASRPLAQSRNRQNLVELEENPGSFQLFSLTPIWFGKNVGSLCHKREDLDLKVFVWTQPPGELHSCCHDIQCVHACC